MPTLPQMEVISRYPTLTISRGYHDSLGLNVYVHEYAEKDEHGQTNFVCYVTDRPTFEMTESPALCYGQTPQEAFENALKDFGYDLFELEAGYDPRRDGANYLGAIYFGDDPGLEYLLFHDSSTFDWVDKLLLLTKQWQYPHLDLR